MRMSTERRRHEEAAARERAMRLGVVLDDCTVRRARWRQRSGSREIHDEDGGLGVVSDDRNIRRVRWRDEGAAVRRCAAKMEGWECCRVTSTCGECYGADQGAIAGRCATKMEGWEVAGPASAIGYTQQTRWSQRR